MEAPDDEAVLITRARALAGRTLEEVATRVGWSVPADLRRAKGFVGMLVERCLGADARSKAMPDFSLLGVELKTVPVDRWGRPRESTFVTTVPLAEMQDACWEQSTVRRKLLRVLWIPVEADRSLPLGARRIGSPLLWSPSRDEERALESDWEDFAELVRDGFVESITAHRGVHLQVRPKARNSRARGWGVGPDGDALRTLPRGFYLRASFTRGLFARHYLVQSAMIAQPPAADSCSERWPV